MLVIADACMLRGSNRRQSKRNLASPWQIVGDSNAYSASQERHSRRSFATPGTLAASKSGWRKLRKVHRHPSAGAARPRIPCSPHATNVSASALERRNFSTVGSAFGAPAAPHVFFWIFCPNSSIEFRVALRWYCGSRLNRKVAIKQSAFFKVPLKAGVFSGLGSQGFTEG